MFLEKINKIVVSLFNDLFEEINNDEYPKNYIEINGEVIEYEWRKK